MCSCLVCRFHTCSKHSTNEYQETIHGHGTVPGKIPDKYETKDESMREGHEGQETY